MCLHKPAAPKIHLAIPLVEIVQEKSLVAAKTPLAMKPGGIAQAKQSEGAPTPLATALIVIIRETPYEEVAILLVMKRGETHLVILSGALLILSGIKPIEIVTEK